MAEDNTQPSDRITVGIEEDTTAVSFDGRGNTSTAQTGDSLNQSFNSDGEALSATDLAELEGDLEADGDKADAEPTEGDGDKADAETPEDEAALPEWNGDDEAVSSAYDAKYISQDEAGKDVLNFEAFNEEFSKDRGEGKRDLNPGTRQYLKDRFGISDKLIDSHLAGVVAQEKLAADTFHLQFGGTPEEGQRVYSEMFGWAKETYSAAQKERYNAAMKAGGEAALEQIELLKTRFITKNPGKPGSAEGKPSGIGLKRQRGVSPKQNATGGETAKATAASPFANAEEHRKAQNEALKLAGKDRDAKLNEVRKRLEASTFWRA